MKINFKWKNPPENVWATSKKPDSDFSEVTGKLINSPNKWAKIATGKRPSFPWIQSEMKDTATHLNATGSFEFASRMMPDGTCKFYARWIPKVVG